MYEPHQECVSPQPQDRLWRYMNLPKFLDLLETQELFFCQLNKLDDSFEGALSSHSVGGLRRQLEQLGHTDPSTADELAKETYTLNQYFSYVNCWHLSPHESMAMWKQYGNDGIAITTTFDGFRNAIDFDPHRVNIGKVKYGNYTHLSMNFGNTLAPLFHKREEFNFEREVRAALMVLPENRGPTANDLLALSQEQPSGVRIQIDVPLLIDKVYVSPGKSGWYRHMLERVLARYDYGLSVEISTIDKSPIFT